MFHSYISIKPWWENQSQKDRTSLGAAQHSTRGLNGFLLLLVHIQMFRHECSRSFPERCGCAGVYASTSAHDWSIPKRHTAYIQHSARAHLLDCDSFHLCVPVCVRMKMLSWHFKPNVKMSHRYQLDSAEDEKKKKNVLSPGMLFIRKQTFKKMWRRK